MLAEDVPSHRIAVSLPHLCDSLRPASATADEVCGLNNQIIFAQIVWNPPLEAGLHARRPNPTRAPY